MRESRTSGSVRGARDNPRPYRYRSNRTGKHLSVSVLVNVCDKSL
jgi:hypothetical protein